VRLAGAEGVELGAQLERERAGLEVELGGERVADRGQLGVDVGEHRRQLAGESALRLIRVQPGAALGLELAAAALDLELLLLGLGVEVALIGGPDTTSSSSSSAPPWPGAAPDRGARAAAAWRSRPRPCRRRSARRPRSCRP
jgi:hypothetical protein